MSLTFMLRMNLPPRVEEHISKVKRITMDHGGTFQWEHKYSGTGFTFSGHGPGRAKFEILYAFVVEGGAERARGAIKQYFKNQGVKFERGEAILKIERWGSDWQ
jgi:hypothetical protein